MSTIRQSRHIVVQTTQGQLFVISRLATREDAQIISVDMFTGALCYSARPGIDLFPTEDIAFKYLTNTLGVKVQTKTDACAIVGYAIVSKTAHLLIATKIRPELRLPGGHVIYTIVDTLWLHTALHYTDGSGPQSTHKKVSDLLTGFQVADNHFFCETYDLTRPFPSEHAVDDIDSEFCFNNWLASPFSELGMRSWCVVLVQGAAIGRPCAVYGTEVNVSLITRKSRLNAGARFYARGINEVGGSGNEAETQLLMWYADAEGVSWVAQLWRRGTVPLWWRSELRSTMGEAETVISDRPYDNVHLYWQTLQKRYPDSSVHCLNLLRCDPDGQEMLLSQHFAASVEQMMQQVKLPVKMMNFDWHQHAKMLGLHESVQVLWAKLSSVLSKEMLAHGEMRIDAEGRVVASKHSPQTLLLRLNCADSLDRTNLASFFISLQTMLEMCRMLALRGLPSAPASEPWSWLRVTVDAASKAIPQSLLAALAEMYVRTGDVMSGLYTNSVATMSSAIRAFAPALAKPPYDATIAIQRRYQNYLRDEERQQQYDTFLGIKGYRDACRPPPRLLSSYPAQLLAEISHHGAIDLPESMSILNDQSVYWVLPQELNAVVLKIWLGRRARVEELVVTLRHGVCDATSPHFVDVLVGDYLEDRRAVLQDVVLPRCADGSTIYLPLSDISPTPLYRFYNLEKRVGPLCRAIYIVLRGVPATVPMTFGKVSVLGSWETPEMLPLAAQARLDELMQPIAAPADGAALPAGSNLSTVNLSTVNLSTVNLSTVTPAETVKRYQDAVRRVIELADEQLSEVARRRSASIQPHLSASPATTPLDEAMPATGLSRQSSDSAVDSNSHSADHSAVNTPPAPTSLTSPTITTSAPFRAVQLTLSTALQLEKERVALQLTPAQRDEALLAMRFVIDCFNPNRYVSHRDPAVEAVAWLAGVPGTCDSCRESVPSIQSCHYCYMKCCPRCLNPALRKIVEYNWQDAHPVCRNCGDIVTEQESLVQFLTAVDRQAADDSVRTQLIAVAQLIGQTAIARRPHSLEVQPIALFPHASILSLVPTALDSVPVEFILLPSDVCKYSWRAPAGVTQASIVVLLPQLCALHFVELTADNVGYSDADAINISVGVGEFASSMTAVGSWEVNASVPDQTVSFALDSPASGVRVVTLTVSLRNPSASGVLRLRHVSLLGVPQARAPVVTSPFAAQKTKMLLDAGTAVTRTVVRPLLQSYRDENRVLDICVPLSLVSGFEYVVTSQDEYSAALISVSAVTLESGKLAATQKWLGNFTIPKARQGSLWFEFAAPTQCNVVIFQALRTQGGGRTFGRDPPMDKIRLFTYP